MVCGAGSDGQKRERTHPTSLHVELHNFHTSHCLGILPGLYPALEYRDMGTSSWECRGAAVRLVLKKPDKHPR